MSWEHIRGTLEKGRSGGLLGMREAGCVCCPREHSVDLAQHPELEAGVISPIGRQSPLPRATCLSAKGPGKIFPRGATQRCPGCQEARCVSWTESACFGNQLLQPPWKTAGQHLTKHTSTLRPSQSGEKRRQVHREPGLSMLTAAAFVTQTPERSECLSAGDRRTGGSASLPCGPLSSGKD